MIFSRANFGTLLTSIAVQGCGAATGILTARLLGPASRGELATVILWPTVFSNLALMGCQWVLAREVAGNPDRENDWINAGICTALATSFLYLLFGYYLLELLIPSDRTYLLPLARLCLWLIPLDVANQILLAVEQGRMRWRRYNLLRLTFFVFYLAFVVLTPLVRLAEVRWFVGAFLASQLLTLLVRLWLQRRAIATGQSRIGQCCHLLRAGVPYFGATVSNLITLQLDTVLVVSLLSTQAAGIYVVAGTFAGGLASLGDALGITSFALASNETDFASQGKILSQTFRQSALLSSGAGLILAGLIPFLVRPLFGAAFIPAIWPAVILALAAAWTCSMNILNQGLRGAGRPHAGLVSQVIGAGVMTLTALLFVGHFGLLGVACAVLLSACVQVVVLIAAAANWLRISLLDFWPFGGRNLKLFWEELVSVRLRFSRSLA